jgi:hypothetical protein
MTVVLDALSAELAAAGDRLARRSARRRRRARIAVIVTVALLALVGASIATGTFLWQPQLGQDFQGHPTASASEVPAAQLALLGVLRRPQTDSDRGMEGRYAASWLGTSFRGVRTNSIRVLTNGAVLISAERGPSGDDSLCLFLRDTEAGGMSCFTTDQLRRGLAALIRIPAPAQPGASPGSLPARVTGIVPDGVAAVRFGTTTVQVEDNAYDARLEPGVTPRGTPLDSNGNPWSDADGERAIPGRAPRCPRPGPRPRTCRDSGRGE